VADGMRDDLRVMMHLEVTPLGAKMAEEERPEIEEDIINDLPKLTAADLTLVYTIVGALADNHIVA